MTVVFLPDPTTRECPIHRGVLETDARPCIHCWGKREMDAVFARLHAAVSSPEGATE